MWIRGFQLQQDEKMFIKSQRAVADDRLNIKMPSYRYRNPRVKDKTYGLATVLSLTWEFPYIGT